MRQHRKNHIANARNKKKSTCTRPIVTKPLSVVNRDVVPHRHETLVSCKQRCHEPSGNTLRRDDETVDRWLRSMAPLRKMMRLKAQRFVFRSNRVSRGGGKFCTDRRFRPSHGPCSFASSITPDAEGSARTIILQFPLARRCMADGSR